jgi:hypothetical protein
MPDRIALKRLTVSDLTFFETLFRKFVAANPTSTKQKAINLNADVFIKRFYPALPALVSTLGDVITVTLTVLGPSGAPAHTISRAVTKGSGYKNWRLNGEFLRDPEKEVGRFDDLKTGDLAVMEFSGDPGPQRLTLLLIEEASPVDGPLYAALSQFLPGERPTMIQISRAQIAAAAASIPSTHPIWLIAADPEFDAAVEDAAEGGVKGTITLLGNLTKNVTAATLAAAKAAAEKNGRDGEALAWVQLQKMKNAGAWASIEWRAKANAVAPFDFLATDTSGASIRIDAKSTAGEFERVIHMSAAELTEAAKGGRYDLWRVYAIDEDGARLRITEGIGDIAKSIIDALALPAGITIDSVSINPDTLKWGAEIKIERPEEETDDE